MSERSPHGHEQLPDYGELGKELKEVHHKTPEKEPAKHEDSIEHILEKIEKEARSSSEISSHHTEKDQSHKHETANYRVNSQLKSHALNQTLQGVRRKLPVHERTFSKMIHNPTVDTISTGVAATLARPSSLLSGGVFSVVGSLAALFICRHYGYEYNFLVGIACFVGGFFLGLFYDAVWNILKRF